MSLIVLSQRLRNAANPFGGHPLLTAKRRGTSNKPPTKLLGRTDFALGCALFLVLVAVTAKTQAATITVTGTGDTVAVDGLVTLREAITSSNTNANVNADVVAVGAYGMDTINFNIPGAGVHTISPSASQFTMQISDPAVIDGYTQPGAAANTDPNGFNGTLLIELNGLASGSVNGLDITAGNTTVRGLVINNFQGLTGGAGNAFALTSGGGNHIEGNFIGTDATGTIALANRNSAIAILNSPDNTVGGPSPQARNVISGNALAFFILTSGNVIQGNFIGTQKDGVSPLGNNIGVGFVGVGGANNNLIGGTVPGAGNVIAFTTGFEGILMEPTSGTGNSFLGNSIFSNNTLGIDLNVRSGVTPNDPCDTDTGANNLQNFPVLTSVTSSGGNTTIAGTFNSVASTTYRLEFFANNSVNPSGFGEGQIFLGTTDVTTDGTCNSSFNVNVPQITGNQRVTATATDPQGNTSEFSAAIGQLLNISSRLRVQTGENILIGGFIITGTEPKRVIARGIGPSLTAVGVKGALADPVLELRGPGTFATITNDNWRSDQQAEIEATGIAPTNDAESAIVATLPANNSGYTAIVRGKDNTTGVGVVEAYDLDTAVNSKLGNISTRGLVETGNDILIGGFIAGNGVTKVIIRAIGPTLSGAGVSNPLLDPTMELFNSSGTSIAANDNWRTTQETEIIATTIPPADDRESAIVARLTPGSYTAVVRGTNNTTGIAVVEVYNIP